MSKNGSPTADSAVQTPTRHITGAADETGFAGFGGFGGREELLAFGDVDAPSRAFRFERTDTDTAVAVSFDPSATGVDPDSGGGVPIQKLSKSVADLLSGRLSKQVVRT